MVKGWRGGITSSENDRFDDEGSQDPEGSPHSCYYTPAVLFLTPWILLAVRPHATSPLYRLTRLVCPVWDSVARFHSLRVWNKHGEWNRVFPAKMRCSIWNVTLSISRCFVNDSSRDSKTKDVHGGTFLFKILLNTALSELWRISLCSISSTSGKCCHYLLF